MGSDEATIGAISVMLGVFILILVGIGLNETWSKLDEILSELREKGEGK